MFPASLFPIIITASKKSISSYYKGLKKLYILLFILGSLFSVITFVFANFFIVFLFSLEYYNSIAILEVHSFSIILIFLMFITNNYLILKNEKKIILFTDIITAIINI